VRIGPFASPRRAKCSVATVYNRRDLWRNEIGIDIAFPPQLVIDVLHFGSSSTARPENVAKMLAAVKAENGAALLELYTEALADFEDKRVTILNPALLARPRAMLLEGPPSAPPELDDGGDDLVDEVLKDIDLLEEEPVSEAQATSKIGKRRIRLRGRSAFETRSLEAALAI
jgi:hypothetical protein